ncbi:MAG TPA: type I-B CRISPR-associated protein Cas7/Csh2 [Ignavibacteria bacterium]
MENKRSEIIFLYDVKYCNPNGDPMDANRPRIDEETGKCLVTDVRLKRTIRDYLFENGYNGIEGSKGDIFVRDEDGKSVTGTQRAKSYKDIDEFKNKFVDVRLFGGVSAPKAESKTKQTKDEDVTDEVKVDTKKTFNLTGPVQFGMGVTLNKVKENFIKGTGAFTTSEKAIQKTFREEYNISYGLVGFHGVINENAGKYSGLKDEDISALLDAMWNGTKNLLTRSKKGHMPRLLVKIDYKEPNYFIGDLIERLSIIPNDGVKEDELIDVGDYKLDTRKLNETLKKYNSKIDKIHVINIDERIRLTEELIKI